MTGKIVWSVVGLAVVALLGVWLIYIPLEVLRAQRHPLTATPASAGIAYEDASFPSRGDHLTIRAWWMPAPSVNAVLVFVHGGNSNRIEEFSGGLQIAKFLIAHRISVLSPDLRNHGASDSSPDGQLTMGVDESNDVEGAIDYAVRRAPGLPVYVMGTSMGGASAIYAVERDARVKKLVLVDPLLDPQDTSVEALHAMLGAPRWLFKPVVWSAETFFAHVHPSETPLAAAERLTLPILLIKDRTDPVCRAVSAKMLADRNPQVHMWLVPAPTPANAAALIGSTYGAHAAAFRLYPDEEKTRLLAFLQ